MGSGTRKIAGEPILAFNCFLQNKINVLNETNEVFLLDNNLKGVVDYLKNLKNDAIDNPYALIINGRLTLFVNYLSAPLENAKWESEVKKGKRSFIVGGSLFVGGAILGLSCGLYTLGSLLAIVGIIIIIVVSIKG